MTASMIKKGYDFMRIVKVRNSESLQAYGLWLMAYGGGAMDHGRWTMDDGRRTTIAVVGGLC